MQQQERDDGFTLTDLINSVLGFRRNGSTHRLCPFRLDGVAAPGAAPRADGPGADGLAALVSRVRPGVDADGGSSSDHGRPREGYTMRDQRHTYAVRAIRAGTPAELVARQLGHVNAVLVHKVYGRFAPRQDERDRWERAAAAMHAANTAPFDQCGSQGAVLGAVAEKQKGQARVSDCPIDSRGGTRTLDPGIMSAVL
jgi:hypothetical protein